MHVFYTPDLDASTYTLNEAESKHCTQVLRLSAGDKIVLTDGRGGLFDAEIVNAGKKRVDLKILFRHQDVIKRNNHLHIAVAPTKNIDRIEWFLEKATEMGIDEITPVICDRSERKVVKDERLDKVITSAVKQSLQAWHPVLHAQRAFKDLVKDSGGGPRFIAHCAEGEKQYLADLLKAGEDALILIGPEGDFTPAEIDMALENGFKPITLGNTRLRTETAALAACFEANYINR